MTAEPILLVERPQPGVVVLRLNRPDRRNALATPLLQDIAAALVAAEADQAVHAVVVTGSDTVFAAGADIDEVAAADSDDPIESPRFLAWRMIRAFPKPLLAAVEGWCLGAGLELAMCCDIVVAGDGARFGQPEINLGIIPGAGGTVTLTRLVGRALATRMVLTGDPIDARRALEAGLIAEVVAAGDALSHASILAGTIAGRAPLAMRAAKASLRQAGELFERDHIMAERARFVALLGSADKQEGIAAFKQKRAPIWRGA